jgi:glycosyltransferase involved in cell wall biosynthesis
MEKELTIIVPVYNGVLTMYDLLKSLFDCDHIDFDIIIVDDGSTDETCGIISKYNVRSIKLDKNYGISHARNIGIELAQTEYVAFVDADCIVQKNWLDIILFEFKKLREKDKNIAAMSGRVLPFRENFIDYIAAYVEHWEYQGGHIEERVKLSTSNCICDKKAIFSVGKFDESLVVDEDRELALKMISNGYKVFYNPNVFVKHHHNRTSLGKIFAHQFWWGEKTGLINEWRYRNIRKLWFLRVIKNPIVYFMIIPFLCLILTARITKRIFKENKTLLWAVPFIFIAKVFYRLGVLKWILKNKI